MGGEPSRMPVAAGGTMLTGRNQFGAMLGVQQRF
jgi:hypothetical protein